MTNGEVRMLIYNGTGKGTYRWVFCGNARDNFSEETIANEPISNLEAENFIVRATVRNRIKER